HPTLSLLFFPCSAHHRALHSFPTRRSSDLSVVPDDVPFYQGSIAERVLLDSIIDECGIGAIMHFAGSIVVPESVDHPLKYYANKDRKSTRLNSSHSQISYAVFCLKKKKKT